MLITRKSRLSGKLTTLDIPITEEQHEEWLRFEDQFLIQDFFTDLSADHREFLLTGISPQEWNAIFAKDDND